jgi:hypothetical protein
MRYTSQKQVRAAFWLAHPEFSRMRRPGLTQNDYSADIRTAFIFYVDQLQREGRISDNLAEKVTL